MLNILNSRIALSGATIVAAGALIAGATFAFFSDTETSRDNVFQAGAIDLKIDNTSYALDFNIPGFQEPTGAFVANPANTWASKDLVLEKFFNFIDLKPGDYGEDTISIKVETNDAWLCAAAKITSDDDNGFSEPEDEVSLPNNDSNDGTPDGDLDNGLEFAFWVDDGDNVFEDDEEETQSVFLSGPLSNLNPEGKIALADSTGGPLGPGPVPGGKTKYIGKIWCYGKLTPNLAIPGNGSPADRQETGFICDGSSVGNIGQTDKVIGDLQFYAVQSRNNPNFTCSQNYTPVWPTVTPTPTIGEQNPT